MPPVPLPQRMWAGSQIDFLRPIFVGDALVRRSTISGVSLKQGRTGPLAFVNVLHEIFAHGEAAIRKRQDIGIHCDRRYATEVEGYPGLVVQGPLIATLLLDLLRRERPEGKIVRFEFLAIKPLFDIAPFEVCGRMEGPLGVRLWAVTPEGHCAMEAGATLV